MHQEKVSLLNSFIRFVILAVAAAVGIVVVFIAWWVLLLALAALLITAWVRRLLGKPPLFQAVFRTRAGVTPGEGGPFGGMGVMGGMPPGAGGVEPPAEGAVVIEGEYVVEGEDGARRKLDSNDANDAKDAKDSKDSKGTGA